MSTSTNFSAVLLATAAVIQSRDGRGEENLNAEQKARLKAALEMPGAMIAVTGGEYLGIYERPSVALQAAIAFQNVADTLVVNGSSFAGRVVLEAWPATAEDVPVERVHQIMAYTQEGCVLTTPEFGEQISIEHKRNLIVAANAEIEPTLKGVREYAWKESATTYREHTRVVSAANPTELYASVSLTRRDKAVEVNPKDCPFSIGRDSTCAMAVGGTSVSRFHGEVQFENGKFYYRDLSRNGSYLTSAGEEVFLQQERFPLVSRGVISPGAPLLEQTGDVIKYQCNSFGGR